MSLRYWLVGISLALVLCFAVLSPAASVRAWEEPLPDPSPSSAKKMEPCSYAPERRLLDPREKRIIFTANQDFLSRIYVLHMDGSVDRYFEFFAYRWVDLEVVNNELYASEAFAPRVYKIDIRTGDLEVVIDDWSLYYFYGLGFDGTYFYLDEWNFRRYDLGGSFQGSTSFSDDVFGCAWDGVHLWTLGDDNLVKCWDISLWPRVSEVFVNHFTPPSPDCRGLWFDGTCFWTAESIPDTLGKIYRFDHQGHVVDQWLAPAWQGWGACMITIDP
ncbi:MAG: hypothetical protein KJ645_08370 [Planctomycetes bacterium]|nr:hypothetical protein [Planctomycetota bacterium]